MEKTPRGTSVGVDDPYATVDRCDHLTDDGRCRYAAEHGHHDPEFARQRHEDDLRCPVVDPEREARSASECASSAERSRSRDAEGVSRDDEDGQRPSSNHSADHSSGRKPREDGEQSDPRAGDWDWSDCPHFRARQRSKECVRCGLEERRIANEDERPLLEEHHLMYADSEAPRASDASSAERSRSRDDDAVSRDERGTSSHGPRERAEGPREDGEQERGATNGSASDSRTGREATREPSDPRADHREELAHEITVYLCRWCHAKIHRSWARLDDDASPDPEAIAEAEGRRSREHEEFGFETAADRFGDGDGRGN